MTNIVAIIGTIMILTYILDIVFHFGIFDKLIEFLERDNKK
jgi:hypothetical protein